MTKLIQNVRERLVLWIDRVPFFIWIPALPFVWLTLAILYVVYCVTFPAVVLVLMLYGIVKAIVRACKSKSTTRAR